MATTLRREVPSNEALAILNANGRRSRFPRRFKEARTHHRLPPHLARSVFPDVKPSFAITPGSRVFTIGSCFAREVETHLDAYDLPTTRLVLPKEEWPWRANGALNVYTPGAIAQRIERAFGGGHAPVETIVPHGRKEGFVDLLLPGMLQPSTMERVLARRDEIDEIYRELPSSDTLVLTLGFVEAWFDLQTGEYLNRIPPSREIEVAPERYVMRVLDVDDAYPLLEHAFELLDEAGLNVLLTVSPVPISATFSGEDAVVADSYSKSVLRVCAARLARRFKRVDYFPGFEIIRSGGVVNYQRDQIHVKPDVVRRVTRYMTSVYAAGPRR